MSSEFTPEEEQLLKLYKSSYDWEFLRARPNQLPPDWDWRYWLIRSGRGFGKTRCGAEWIRKLAERGETERIALVGRTAADVRDTMIEGESGILEISRRDFMPRYIKSERRLEWPNGVRATCYSGKEPDQLRGPQHGKAWVDELAAFMYAEDAWSNLLMGLRLGKQPQVCITTTPRATKLIKKLSKHERTALVTGSTSDNVKNLAPDFVKEIYDEYQGTRLGRQELDGEILDDVEGALWNHDMLDAVRVRVAPELVRTCVAVDPATTKKKNSDLTGIVVCGIDAEGFGYVLKDVSGKYSPNGWAELVRDLYDEYRCAAIVAEINQGGDLVANTLRTIGVKGMIRTVHATIGKALRAEPVVSLYEQGRVRHVGTHAKLEDEMTTWEPRETSDSPNRIDAAVYGISWLMLGLKTESDMSDLELFKGMQRRT